MFYHRIVASVIVSTMLAIAPTQIAGATTVKTRTHNTSTHSICDFESERPKCSRTSVWKASFFTGLYYEAENFVGLHERKNAKAIQQLTDVNPRVTPWCAAFVNGILKKRGYDTSGSNRAISFIDYGRKVTDPQRGDIVVFKSHVGFFQGFVYKNGRKYVAVLGGNQSNSVKVSYYPVNKVRSYRRPV